MIKEYSAAPVNKSTVTVTVKTETIATQIF